MPGFGGGRGNVKYCRKHSEAVFGSMPEIWRKSHLQSVSAELAVEDTELDGQATHCVLSWLEYVLRPQSAHASVAAAVDAEYFPAAHCVHSAGPMLALNFPASPSHAVQGPPFGPV